MPHNDPNEISIDQFGVFHLGHLTQPTTFDDLGDVEEGVEKTDSKPLIDNKDAETH